MKYKNLKRTLAFSIALLSFLYCSAVKAVATEAEGNKAEKAFSYSKDRFCEDSVSASSKPTSVYVGGMPFGIKFYSEGITVVGFSDVDTDAKTKSPAYDAGLRENDVILNVNSTAVSDVEDFLCITEKSKGDIICIDYRRQGKVYSTSFSPVLSKSENKYKTGMWVKDSTAGIGTVTYIVPETKAFAGLGHSICDSKTGELLKMTKGIVTDVQISGVEKGIEGTPGELKGAFSGGKSGTLVSNTAVGVFGIYADIPSCVTDDSLIEMGKEKDVKEGPATVRCTLGDGGIEEFEVQITSIDFKEESNKNFVIEVTDERLIERTGGVVQGLSGSPLIQNGKLIGAVTHVFISDPKKGYGIFIERMNEKMPEILK